MKITGKTLISPVIGTVLLVVITLFFRTTSYYYFLVVIALILSALPFVILLALETKEQREKDERFLEFSRDLVENVKTGTPINKSILNLMKRDYGVLSPHILKLGNQIHLGIPLERALKIFADDTNSPVISRSVSLISEAQKAGGEIVTILSSVSSSVDQAETLKKEQKASVYNLVVQGYIIFIVFIIILLVLDHFILPLTSDLGGSGFQVSGSSGGASSTSSDDLSKSLFGLLITQSFFAGLVIGKISEGTLKSGVKHSFILVALALLISTGADILLATP